MVILSFPGPDRSINIDKLNQGKAISRRYRNRRIGEFLKELELTEGRSTGIPKIIKAMKENNSPCPVFETDEEYSSFMVRLPVHEHVLEKQLLKTPVEAPVELSKTEYPILLGLQKIRAGNKRSIKNTGIQTEDR